MTAVPRASALTVLLVTWLMAGLAMAAPTEKPAVSAIRIGLHPTVTRVVIDLSAAADYRVFTLQDPPRAVIDLSDTTLDLAADQAPPGRGLIEDVRTGRPAPGISRVTLDLSAPAGLASVVLLAAVDDHPYRLVVDLSQAAARTEESSGTAADLGGAAASGGAGAPVDIAAAEPGEAAEAAPEAGADAAAAGEEDAGALDSAAEVDLPWPPVKPAWVAAASQALAATAAKKQAQAQGLPVIVIDPGHGGIDPGAIGVDGLSEKTVTLAVAKALREQLLATGRFRVIMTRSDDTFVRLRARFEVARAARAMLFVSLHADSHENPRMRGASVYTLSEKSSDKEAGALAAKENKADLLPGVDLPADNEVLGNILVDMRRFDTLLSSSDLAEDLVKSLAEHTRLQRNTHRFAGFAVLKAPDVPSVLVELGYLSNRKDNALLRAPKHQAALAASIVEAIEDYARDHPPPQEARLNAP